MNAKNKSQSETSNAHEVMTFQFSESKQEIRNLLIESKPWFVAKDVCDVLDIQNNRQAVRELDDDEKLMYKIYTSGQNRKTWLVSESGLYALIIRSNKPQAKIFRKWITSEVIPALLKKGYYAMHQKSREDFIDARDVPYQEKEINGYNVRYIAIDEIIWVSVNDVNKAMHSSTSSNQVAKKLNAKQELAKKIWLYGNTNPAWFTNDLGLRLMMSGSRKLRNANQLSLQI